MAFVQSLLLVLVFLVGYSRTEDNYTECHRKRGVLLNALYKTVDNLYQLESAFAPPTPGEISSRYIKVNYMFADDESNTKYGNCTVTYVWAIGGFLIAHPPKIFQFTSLLFSIPANKRTDIDLKLPYECRPLINESICSCYDDNNAKAERLLVLTNQLNQYAKYDDPVNVVQDISSRAKSVCIKKIKDSEYFDSDVVGLFFSLTVLVPLIVLAILLAIVRSSYQEIHAKITRTSRKGYQNLAGLTLASIFLLLYILFLDVAAVHAYQANKHELSMTGVEKKANIFSPAITLTFDFFFTVLSLNSVFYLVCVQLLDWKPQMKPFTTYYFRIFIAPILSSTFGRKTTGHIVRGMEDSNQQIQEACKTWVLAITMIAPLFCFASHIGYILVAWLTEPARGTANFLVGLVCVVYMFFMFRQVYTVHENRELNTLWPSKSDKKQSELRNVDTESAEREKGATYKEHTNLDVFCGVLAALGYSIVIVLPTSQLYSLYVMFHHLWYFCRSCRDKEKDEPPKGFPQTLQLEDQQEEDNKLNFHALFIAFSMGWLIIMPIVIIVSAFILFPVSTFPLAQYIENAGQIVIVIIGLLISYKIFSNKESDIEKFTRTFKEKAKIPSTSNTIHRQQQQPQQQQQQEEDGERKPLLQASNNITYDNYDTVEVAGAIMGELANRVYHHLPPAPSEPAKSEPINYQTTQ